MFNLKQKKKEDLNNDSSGNENLSRQQEIEQEEKMRAVAKEKAEKELKEEKSKKNMKNGAIGCAILVGLIIIGSLFSSGGDTTTSTKEKKPAVSWEEQDNSIAAYIMAERFVKERLKSPSTAKFPGRSVTKNQIIKGEDNQYIISSYVDSQNSFGATIRTNFMVIVKQVDKDNWRLVDIEFFEN